MRKYAWLTDVCMILLCGCSHPDDSITQTADSTAPVVSAKETDAPPAAGSSVPAVPEQTPAEILESYAADDPQGFQGGIGGEEHAETPLPEYFTYRFLPDSVTMRLAGGNYQAILYDFSETFAHNAYYYLNDYNDDGYFDLCAPVKYDGDRIAVCAVFLWKPEDGKFSETPILDEASAETTLQEENDHEE